MMKTNGRCLFRKNTWALNGLKYWSCTRNVLKHQMSSSKFCTYTTYIFVLKLRDTIESTPDTEGLDFLYWQYHFICLLDEGV